MKPNKRHSANDRRLQCPALNEAAMNRSGGAAGIEQARVAKIKLQFAFGNYHVDTEVLAAKMLDADVLCASRKNDPDR